MILIGNIALAFIFGLIALNTRLLQMLTAVFNLGLAIFLSMIFTPVLIKFFEEMDYKEYHDGLLIVLITAIIFIVLQVLCVKFLTKNTKGAFPEVVDRFGSVLLGFLFGYMLSVLVFFAIVLTPLNKHEYVITVAGSNDLTVQTVVPMESMIDIISKITLQPEELAHSEIPKTLMNNDEKETEEKSGLEEEAKPEEKPKKAGKEKPAKAKPSAK